MGGAFWSEMANRNILLLFCGLSLLALIQPSLQGGKCVLQVSTAMIFAASITDLEQVQFFWSLKLKLLTTSFTHAVPKEYFHFVEIFHIMYAYLLQFICNKSNMFTANYHFCNPS